MKSLYQIILEVGLSTVDPSKNIFIGCGVAKADHRTDAEHMYIGSLTQKSLEYAEKYFKKSHIFILSAKHHILRLSDIIDPYNLTLKDMSEEEKDKWAKEVIDQARERSIKIDNQYFIAGQDYLEPLEKYIKVNEIGQSQGIGYKMQKLDNAIDKA